MSTFFEYKQKEEVSIVVLLLKGKVNPDRLRCNSRSNFNFLVTAVVVLYADLLGPLI